MSTTNTESDTPETPNESDEPSSSALSVYELEPSGDKQEYVLSHWFISQDGKVVVCPPGRSDGDRSAIVWPVEAEMKARTLPPGRNRDKKSECLISNDFLLNVRWYKKWKGSDNWPANASIQAELMHTESLKQCKSKIFSIFCCLNISLDMVNKACTAIIESRRSKDDSGSESDDKSREPPKKKKKTTTKKTKAPKPPAKKKGRPKKKKAEVSGTYFYVFLYYFKNQKYSSHLIYDSTITSLQIKL